MQPASLRKEWRRRGQVNDGSRGIAIRPVRGTRLRNLSEVLERVGSLRSVSTRKCWDAAGASGWLFIRLSCGEGGWL